MRIVVFQAITQAHNTRRQDRFNIYSEERCNRRSKRWSWSTTSTIKLPWQQWQGKRSPFYSSLLWVVVSLHKALIVSTSSWNFKIGSTSLWVWSSGNGMIPVRNDLMLVLPLQTESDKSRSAYWNRTSFDCSEFPFCSTAKEYSNLLPNGLLSIDSLPSKTDWLIASGVTAGNCSQNTAAVCRRRHLYHLYHHLHLHHHLHIHLHHHHCSHNHHRDNHCYHNFNYPANQLDHNDQILFSVIVEWASISHCHHCCNPNRHASSQKKHHQAKQNTWESAPCCRALVCCWTQTSSLTCLWNSLKLNINSGNFDHMPHAFLRLQFDLAVWSVKLTENTGTLAVHLL